MESVIVVITFWYVQFCPDRLCKTGAMFTYSKLINILLLIFASILNDTFLYAPYLTFLMLKGARSRYFRQFCLILSIMSSKRQIGRARVFHLQNQRHITTENNFAAV